MAARIVRGEGAPAYFPSLHDGVDARRLQGHEAGPTERFWVGESYYHPAGTAQTTPTAEETVYYVLDGELTLTVEDGPAETLGPGDSVHLPRGTVRSLENRTARGARLLVVIAIPTPENRP
ncbi:cupin domain-containing protein [Streptomyces sp. HNM0645]|uniref:cupin domain-containing protein n=1 Tax=Streptomyces sp. HNM0645 TaxID=2782343 RepID=UPI0024B7115D|nr:cupin domain-containing protein [Streptomyces sp. HNM0645]MDI9888361.1 cupin domain-containing protein [Streptomyces sp. HNM0645]